MNPGYGFHLVCPIVKDTVNVLCSNTTVFLVVELGREALELTERIGREFFSSSAEGEQDCCSSHL